MAGTIVLMSFVVRPVISVRMNFQGYSCSDASDLCLPSSSIVLKPALIALLLMV